MPSNKYALFRYRIIDKCIRNPYKKYPGVEDLREACESFLYNSFGEKVSQSTIEKDLKAMRTEEGLGFLAPIKYDKLNKGYYYEDANYSIDNLPLSEDDLAALKIATATLSQFQGVGMFKQFGDAIHKIIEKVNLGEDLNESAYFIHFEPRNSSPNTQILHSAVQAIENRRKIIFQYQKYGSNAVSAYELSPYALKEYKGLWYILGKDLISNTIKTFALNRIIEFEITAVYAGKNDFDVPAYFNHTIGITHPNNAEVLPITLWVDASQIPYLEANPLHSSQQISKVADAYHLQLKLIVNFELLSLILSFGKYMKVIAPNTLKSEVEKMR